MFQERDQIINFLLQSNDQKNKVIEDQQKQIAELTKQLAQRAVAEGQAPKAE